MMTPPETQGLLSKTFKVPPFDVPIPELFDWHAENTPNHPLFVYASESGIRKIFYPEAARAIHRAGYLAQSHIPAGTTNAPVMAILGMHESISYYCLIAGMERAGIVPFPISPRNSPAAIAHLLSKTNAVHIFLGRDYGMNGLFAAASAVGQSHPTVSDIPTFSELFSSYQDEMNFKWLPKRHYDPDAKFNILHSSGSTSLPKPINSPYRRWVQCAHMPFYGERDLCGAIFGIHGIPMFHGLGMMNVAIAPMCGLIMAVFEPTTPAILPTPDKVWEDTIRTATEYLLCVPNFVESWARDPVNLPILKHLKAVIYAGGPLNEEIGDSLHSQGVQLLSLYGTTETMIVTTFLPQSNGDDWDYFTFSPYVDPILIPDGHGMAELMLVECPTHFMSTVNDTWHGKNAYNTNDLFIPHPDPNKTHLWKIFGRSDDQIMLSTGEKTNPIPLESILNQDDHISSAIMFGRGRFQNGVIIEPTKALAFDPDDLEQVAKFRNLIWPTVERANAFAPQHSRLMKEMIVIANPSKPFTITAKGTPGRQVVIAAYTDEIDNLYKTVNEGSGSDIEPPASLEEAPMKEFVRNVVASIVEKAVSDDTDIMLAGCDSLQATWIRTKLLRGLRQLFMPSWILPADFIYQNPSVNQMTAYIIANGRNPRITQDDADDRSKKYQEMLDLVAKYSSNIPIIESDVPEVGVPRGDVILLTGTTGGLGSHVLSHLLMEPGVRRVYAFNRLSSGAKTLEERQREALESRGLDATSILANDKIRLISGDTSKTDLGLEESELSEIRQSLTHIIHNAWPVNFSLSLASFDDQLRGLRNLIDLCLTSSRGPARLLFTSTIGVFQTIDPKVVQLEAPIADGRISIASGYSESKWVSEQILEKVSKVTALKPVIVRVGQLSGASNGSWNTSEWFPSLVASGVQTKCLPDGLEDISWIPLSDAAAAIAKFRNASAHILHLVHPSPTTWRTVIQPISDTIGVPLVPYPQYLKALELLLFQSNTELDALRRTPALKILPFFQRWGRVQITTSGHGVEAFGMANLSVEEACQNSQVKQTPLLGKDDALSWLAYWKKAGLL